MSKLVIEGGRPLRGRVQVSGSKNAALPIIAASLLVPHTTLSNVPHIKDVERMLEIIEYLGGSYQWKDRNQLVINSEHVTSLPLPDIARELRASILFAGPLLARFGEAHLPYPGGDLIGARPIDSHVTAFRDLGVNVEEDESLHLRRDGVCGGRIVLEESSVTATENLLMLASLCPEPTEIRLAAAEPHVQDLCAFLKKSGVAIEGTSSTTLRIKGVNELTSVEHEIIPDELEISAFAALGAATHGDIQIAPIAEKYLDAVLLQLKRIGVNVSTENAA